MNGLQLAVGLGLGALIGAGGYAAGALTRAGAAGAALVGGLTFGFGGWAPALLLVTFFVSSSLLSRWRAGRKRSVVAGFAKGARRDLGQVLANGSVPALLSILLGLTGAELWLAALAGALAAVNADTWATEVGVLARRLPRLITTGAEVPPGTSGGVTSLGMGAAVLGALMIAAVGALASGDLRLLLPVTAAGFLGALFDSLFGASVQAMYVCTQCGEPTERHPQHHCGGQTRPLRGWRWLGNDGVNFLAAVLGAAAGAALWQTL